MFSSLATIFSVAQKMFSKSATIFCVSQIKVAKTRKMVGEAREIFFVPKTAVSMTKTIISMSETIGNAILTTGWKDLTIEFVIVHPKLVFGDSRRFASLLFREIHHLTGATKPYSRFKKPVKLF
jgi:hypothetical protein